jgi:DNA-binding cell septation regulator SpoVG
MTFPLKVTEVHIHFIPQNQGLFALARIVLNDALVIDGIGVHQKRHGDGFRLTYPNRRLNNGEVVTIAHPIQQELSKAIETAVFQKIEAIQKDVDQDDRYRPTDN